MSRLVILALLLLTALSARAADNLGWHVVREGETLESITQRYLGSSKAWRENWKLNPELKNPHAILPGQRLRVIVSRELPARSAEISKVAHKVERKPEPQPWVAATSGDQLRERHGIRTFVKSSAELRFDDETRLTLTEDSLVFLREAKQLPEMRDRSTIEIVDGQGDLEKPARPARVHDVEIIVGAARAKPSAAPGEKASARVRNDQGAARLMAYRGGAALSSGGSTVDVGQGMGSSAPADGGPPTPPERLLPAPAILPLARTRSPRPLFEWQPLSGAATYIVEVCGDERCTQLVDRVAGLTATRWQPEKPLPLGGAFWRVTARSATSLDGYPSEPQKLWVGFGVAGVVREERFRDDHRGGSSSRVMIPRPIVNASLTLHRENGDGFPSPGDEQVARTSSDSRGAYSFDGITAGDYWIVIDSRSLGVGWAEQTSGPRGAWCADGHASTKALEEAGPCFGGRRAKQSDDARTLATSEHVALVTVGEEGTGDADFGFSFDVVTHTGDDDRAAQGSLRQFVRNANARPGPNAMHFVPLTAPEATGSFADRWWIVALSAALPDFVDTGTSLDGRAFSPLSGTIPLATHPGAARASTGGTIVVEQPRVGTEGVELLYPEDVELELAFAPSVREGLRVRGRAGALHHLALHGAETNVIVDGSASLQNVVVGLRADGGMLSEESAGSTGLLVTGGGAASLRRAVIAEMSSHGVRVESGASRGRIDAEHLYVRHCGFGDPAGAGVSLRSDSSRIAYSDFEGNTNDGDGAGIEIRAAGGATANGNVVLQSALRGNRHGIVISGDASGNRVSGTRFEGNELAGVVMRATSAGLAPQRNTITRNRFSGASDRAIDLGASLQGESCAPDPSRAQDGIQQPRILGLADMKAGFELTGVACPGQTVEVYTSRDDTWVYETEVTASDSGSFTVPVTSDRVAILAIGAAGATSALGSR